MTRRYDFTRYTLHVENVGERTAISQGNMNVKENVASFENRNPLPRLSLSLGYYEKKSIVLDSLEMEIYHFPGHDFFERDYTVSADSVKILLQEPISQVWEYKGGDYPYRRFAVVETPVNFIPYQRKGSVGSEFILPEMIFVPEKMYSAYYFRVQYWPWENDERTRFELESDALRNILVLNLQDGAFNCVAMFEDFGGIVASDKYPGVGGIINHLLAAEEIYFSEDMEYEEVVDYWDGKSLREALEDKDIKLNNLRILLDRKYAQIESHLRALVGRSELVDFAKDFKKRHAFAGIELDVFVQAFEARFGIDVRDILDKYYEGKMLPVFYVRDMKVELFEEEKYAQKIASCKVYNPSPMDGTVTILEREGVLPENIVSLFRRAAVKRYELCSEVTIIFSWI